MDAAIQVLVVTMQMTNSAEIHRHLIKEFGEERVPDVRTVRRHRDRLVGEESGPWSPLSPGTEASAILPVLRAVTIRTSGRVIGFSVGVARTLTRLAGAFDEADLGPWQRYVLAAEYRKRESSGAVTGSSSDDSLSEPETSDLDSLLAFKPWTSKEASELYRYALFQGWVELPPLQVLNQVPIGGEIWFRGEPVEMWKRAELPLGKLYTSLDLEGWISDMQKQWLAQQKDHVDGKAR